MQGKIEWLWWDRIWCTGTLCSIPCVPTSATHALVAPDQAWPQQRRKTGEPEGSEGGTKQIDYILFQNNIPKYISQRVYESYLY